jgi:hypothetical protein
MAIVSATEVTGELSWQRVNYAVTVKQIKLKQPEKLQSRVPERASAATSKIKLTRKPKEEIGCS